MSRRVHDSVARHYNSGDGIIAAKNRIVAERLAARWQGRTEPLRVVDLGVGDGALLAHLSTQGVPMQMTGVDVSPAMLREAGRRVPLTTLEARAEEADRHLPHGSYDLVLIDSGGSLTTLSTNALACATDVLVPTAIEHFSLKSIDLLFAQVARVKGNSSCIRLIIPTMFDPRVRQSGELLAGILVSEEEHADWLETQLEAIAQIGESAYLAQQLHD